MWLFISLIMINNSFWYSPISFSNMEIITVVFRTFTAIHYVILMFEFYLIFDLKPWWKFRSLIRYHKFDIIFQMLSCLLIFRIMLFPRLPVYGRTSCICLLAALVITSSWSLLFFSGSIFIILLTSFGV